MRLLLASVYGDDVRQGGAERTIQLLADELKARGHAVRFLRAFPGQGTIGADATVLHSVDWKVSASRRIRNHVNDLISQPTVALAAAVAHHRPDLIHTHNLVGIGTGIWEIARRAGIPLVHTLHDYHLLCPRVTLMGRNGRPCQPSPFLCGLRSRRLLRHADAVSVVVGPSRHVIAAHAGLFRRASVHVARNPVQPATSGRSPAAPASPPRSVGYLGSLDTIKGVGLLLEALPELVELGYVLHIAGDGRLRDAVTDASRRLPGLRYHGHVAGEAKVDFLEACDLGIVPSVWAEPGAPNYTMLEWLSAGRPVLASSRGGLGEVVDETAGCVGIDPTVEGIIAALRAVEDPGTWAELLGTVRPVSTVTVAEYADIHERLYGSLRS